jgi:hypothetical protein
MVVKDVAGKSLSVGDAVAIAETGYRNLVIGTVVKFTPKGMKVKYPHPYPLDLNHETETFRASGMVAKV